MKTIWKGLFAVRKKRNKINTANNTGLVVEASDSAVDKLIQDLIL